MIIDASLPCIGEHVSIIQHPQGGPKQVALTANQVVNIFEHRLQYTTDTMPGSSGSPVFNDDWKVIAIHHEGGNLAINRRGDTMFVNEGILMKYIVESEAI
jgi:endonuclease G